MESAKLQPKSTKSSKSSKKILSVIGSKSKSELNEEDRNAHVAVSAYYKAQARGFEPGHELRDWLTAEMEQNQ